MAWTLACPSPGHPASSKKSQIPLPFSLEKEAQLCLETENVLEHFRHQAGLEGDEEHASPFSLRAEEEFRPSHQEELIVKPIATNHNRLGQLLATPLDSASPASTSAASLSPKSPTRATVKMIIFQQHVHNVDHYTFAC
jgi:hypothetical protein